MVWFWLLTGFHREFLETRHENTPSHDQQSSRRTEPYCFGDDVERRELVAEDKVVDVEEEEVKDDGNFNFDDVIF